MWMMGMCGWGYVDCVDDGDVWMVIIVMVIDYDDDIDYD
jgi:hypothetical protein